ncbi:type I polyketide synthase [Streptomyces sp. DH10]|uniref:type I polyketide synthase n=1 Tax=Streptomyces sp. DH10 TaxID=3040121 RepID=UPI0024433AD7|nr:beta-ketoacyl synthase N-terminal-like domain-containing protein [Streptomyces sp. DH10]MDG9714257.1 beta-ketoacyl synthase N-terminal-like domain-containing protein [Streptomyces sp. DH10]
MEPIAIVGIDCRFPGAPDTRAFWDLLMRSGDGVGEVPRLRWDAKEFHSPAGAPGRTNTTEGGFVSDPDAFDNEFFTISPREAAAMDPQQRLLLQCSWRAVEDAGLAPQRLAGSSTGVFVGIMGNEWAQLHLTDYDNVTAQIGSGNGYCMTANRISYHLDLKGPSLAVDTACSSSLVAVHLAANALLSEECDVALAGGVNVALTPALSIFYTQAGLSAPDGRCKPFSSEADGIGRGEGVGVVVLRRLKDALADGQRVYAVIRGTAVNQDGRSNGITAPNRWAQQDVLAAAYRRAGIEPSEVTFTEGHGTGTALGDMMEIRALGHHHAARTGKPLALGSVKGNLGHTEGAAGIAGLIKVALSLHNRVVPASRFAAKENPGLKLREHGIRLLKAPLRLPADGVVAGLSSFGMGGTNAHAVLESAPPAAARPKARPQEQPSAAPAGIGAALFTLTAPAVPALRRNLLAQAEAAERRRVPVGALAWNSNQVKTGHRYRFAVGASEPAELVARLRAAADDPDLLARLAAAPTGRARTAFLYTGQGSQYPAMTAGLYRDSALYRSFLDEADAALLPHTGRSVRDLVLGGDEDVHLTRWTQPALFAVEYALGRTLAELGVRPDVLLGHSVGEYAAAVLAEALPLDAAARLIAARGALMQELPAGGGMLAVRAARETLEERVAGEPLAGVAAVNGPLATVLSGDLAVLERIEGELAAQGVRTRGLQVSHAFHSPLMEPMLERFAALAGEAGGGVPRIPVYSTVRGRLLDAEAGEAMDAAYWTEHISAPVLFADASLALLDDGASHVVEIGPRPVLSGMLRTLGGARTASGPAHVHPVPAEGAGGRELADALAELYRGGVDPHWDAVYEERDRVPLPLAPYAFSDQHRYWAARTPALGGAPAARAEPALRPVASAQEPASERPEPQATAVAVLDVARGRAEGPVARAAYEVVGAVGGYQPEELTSELRLYEDLGFDSVMVMELKNRLEQRLTGLGELTVQDLLPRLSTVGDLVGFLHEIGAAAPGQEERTA